MATVARQTYRAQWDALGWRERNYFIAREVMDYSIYHYDKDWEENCYYCLWDTEGNPVNTHWVGPDIRHKRPEGHRKTEQECWENDCPSFTSDMGAAWLVVDRMATLYPNHRFYFFRDGERVCAVFTDGNPNDVPYREANSGSDYMAQVICEAALDVFDLHPPTPEN